MFRFWSCRPNLGGWIEYIFNNISIYICTFFVRKNNEFLHDWKVRGAVPILMQRIVRRWYPCLEQAEMPGIFAHIQWEGENPDHRRRQVTQTVAFRMAWPYKIVQLYNRPTCVEVVSKLCKCMYLYIYSRYRLRRFVAILSPECGWKPQDRLPTYRTTVVLLFHPQAWPWTEKIHTNKAEGLFLLPPAAKQNTHTTKPVCLLIFA